MKKVSLKKVKMCVMEQEVDLNYKKQIESCLLNPRVGAEGTVAKEMATVYPIIKKFRDLNEFEQFILLEDAEHTEILERLKETKFIQNTPELHEMIKSIEDAPDHWVKLEEEQA